ncbi:MAG: HIT family protein [Planctomycetes bacterium]|nr:HIT family protein [Planctomycetota bacterium]
MPSIFSKIVAGEIPCHKLLEDEHYLSFLDLRPIKEGHALVIPKKEVDYIFDMDDNDLAGLMFFARRVAKGIERVIPCKKIGLTVVGLEVPHTHIHLVPIDGVRDMDFAKAKEVDSQTLSQLATKIRDYIH